MTGHLVVGKGAKRQVWRAAVLVLADVVLDAYVATVIEIKRRDVIAWLVGEEHRQAVSLVVSEGLLISLLSGVRLAIPPATQTG